MKKLIYACTIAIAVGNSLSPVFAQEEKENPVEFSGSVDTYYKYDFSGKSNIGTSFGSDHNSFSIGMVNFIVSKEVGKTAFVADLSFGPRGGSESLPSNDIHIQNLYMSYAFNDFISVTAGYMGTFVGYEVISPSGNYNYTTSYLFTAGPFQNAGLKFDFALSDNIGLMVGAFNDWNVYTQRNVIGNRNINSLGAQLSINPVENWDANINFLAGENDGTILDLTTTFQVSDPLFLGLNAATYNNGAQGLNESKFAGAAVYLQYGIQDNFGFGLRAEGFSSTSGTVQTNYTSMTVSGNISSGPLMFIPELRVDISSDNTEFIDGSGSAVGTATQFLVAAVYKF